MLGAIISFLMVYAIYALIAWLRKPNNSPDPAVAPHKRIARSIWIYCVAVISVASVMVFFHEIDYPRFDRLRYGSSNIFYFPYGNYSDLRLGSIHDKVEYDSQFGDIHSPRLMGHDWEELPNEKPAPPYSQILSSFHTYDSKPDSKSYGRGMVLRVYNLDEEILSSQGNEKVVYKNIIDSIVTDSSFYQPSKRFTPYSAIETKTYAYLAAEDDYSPVFKKHITIFANHRAYELNFYVDKEVKHPKDINTFDFLDAEFIKQARELDLDSYKVWQEEEAKYRSNLNIKCAIFIGMYIILILWAFSFALRYYMNMGNVNAKAAKIANVLSIVCMATFILLGVSLAGAFCFIHHEHIQEIYQYRFSAYINDEYAASSVLCYGAWFLLLIIPTNQYYIKSYTQPLPKAPSPKSKHGLIYWVVRPFAIMSKYISKSTKAVRDEYNRQISDNHE